MAQVGPKMEQEGGKMGTKKGQEGAKEAQVGPKMGQEGGKMGTQRGQEGAREAQLGPRSGQKKRDPKLMSFWDYFWSRFGVLVGPLAVIRDLLEALIFLILFWNPS